MGRVSARQHGLRHISDQLIPKQSRDSFLVGNPGGRCSKSPYKPSQEVHSVTGVIARIKKSASFQELDISCF